MDRHFTLLVGSVLGASEYVADAIAEALRARGYKVTILTQPDMDDITIVVDQAAHSCQRMPANMLHGGYARQTRRSWRKALTHNMAMYLYVKWLHRIKKVFFELQ